MAISKLRITFFLKIFNLKPKKNTKLFAIGRKSSIGENLPQTKKQRFLMNIPQKLGLNETYIIL
jgi:hypothetical protein